MAFKVHVSRPGGLRRMAVAQHMVVRGAGVKPHIQDVGALEVVGCVSADDGFRRGLAPGLDAAGLHHGGSLIHDLHGARVQLAGGSMNKEGQRHAPVALAADAPVGPAGDHVAQAGLAVLGVKLRFVDGLKCQLAQALAGFVFGENAFVALGLGVHADEPLRCRAVDHRRLMAPAMRVAVGDVMRGKQAAVLAQFVDDQRRGFPDVQAAKERQLVHIAAVALHGVEDVVIGDAVGHAGVKVFHPIGGRRVHDAGAVVSGGVVGQKDRRKTLVAVDAVFVGHVVQRVLELDKAQLLAQRGGQHRTRECIARQAFFDQHRRQHQEAAFGLDQRVLECRVQVQRLIGGNGPGGGGPDDGKGFFAQAFEAEGGGQFVGLGAGKADVQRLRLFIGVFDLKLGQRRAAVKAPVHGLEAAVHKAALHDAFERADFIGLVAEIHGAVRVVPFAQHAQALEVGHLADDLLGGKGTAFRLHLVAWKVAPVQFLYGVFDRQAVAIPARHINRIQAFELARLDDHVLEHFVDRVADVNFAVGVGRAVVQHKLRCAQAHIAQLFVNAFVFPGLDPARLALGQVAAHRKRRVGQVQGAAVIGFVVRHGGLGGKLQGWKIQPREQLIILLISLTE